jgi:uncharacterized protein YydD (DUF2326 family)
MQTVRDLITQYQFQYIFSIIEDDVPNSPLFEWQNDEVILKLDDKSDMGKLFYMSY